MIISIFAGVLALTLNSFRMYRKGLKEYRDFLHWWRIGQLLTGEIVQSQHEVETNSDGDPLVHYKLTYQFALPSGKLHTDNGSLWESGDTARDLIGKKVLMIWSPQARHVL